MSLGVLKEFCVNSKKTFKGTRKIKLLEGMEDSCFSVTRDNSANQLFYTKYLIACHLPCFIWAINFKREMVKKIFLIMEESGIEPETFRMRSGRSTTELHPHNLLATQLTFSLGESPTFSDRNDTHENKKFVPSNG